jgi:hypothetical protein
MYYYYLEIMSTLSGTTRNYTVYSDLSWDTSPNMYSVRSETGCEFYFMSEVTGIEEVYSNQIKLLRS